MLSITKNTNQSGGGISEKPERKAIKFISLILIISKKYTTELNT